MLKEDCPILAHRLSYMAFIAFFEILNYSWQRRVALQYSVIFSHGKVLASLTSEVSRVVTLRGAFPSVIICMAVSILKKLCKRKRARNTIQCVVCICTSVYLEWKSLYLLSFGLHRFIFNVDRRYNENCERTRNSISDGACLLRGRKKCRYQFLRVTW